MLQREWEGRAGEGWGEPALHKTKSWLEWLDSASQPEPAQPWARQWGQQVGPVAPRSCHSCRALGFLARSQTHEHRGETEPCEHQLLSPTPATAGTNPQGCGLLFPPRNVNSPEVELSLAGCGTGTPQARTQSFYCTKTPHTVLGAKHEPVLGHWDAPAEFAPPSKRKGKAAGNAASQITVL